MNNEGTPTPEFENLAPSPQSEKEAEDRRIRIKPQVGQEIVLEPSEIAVVVSIDSRTGQPVVYNLQNCQTRAFARMCLHEALALYELLSTSSYTVTELLHTMKKMGEKEKGKGGLHLFGNEGK